MLALTLATLLNQLNQLAQPASAQTLVTVASSSAPAGRSPSVAGPPRTSPARTVHTRAAAFTHTRPTLRPQSLTTSLPALPSAVSTTRSATSATTAMGTTALTSAQAARLALWTIPGLVNITTELPDGGGEAGTGIVLRSTGLVLTAAHVVAGAVAVHAVDLGDGQTYPATIIGTDYRHDIALIELEDATGLRTARLSTTGVHPLEQVVSIGNAYGRGYPSIGFGPVTALGQTISNPAIPGHRISGLIAADNSIVPGESGGPMINRVGEVIGVNDAYQLTGTDHTPTGVGYAVPIATALHFAQTLLLHHQQAAQLDTRA
jgi:S1-C subfamily serine protease